jgi:hypothetical protein
MLRDLRKLGEELQNRFLEIKVWPEIKLSDADKAKIKALDKVTSINDSTIQFTIKNGDNHFILPNQCFLYAVLVKEFAIGLKDYIEILTELKNSIGEEATWDAIVNQDTTISALDHLDEYSKSLLLRPFKKDDCLLGTKNIISETRGKPIRGDFLSSAILNIINVPVVNSSEIGHLIGELTYKRDLYDYLERRYLPYFDYIRSAESIISFVHSSLSFLIQYDNLTNLHELITQNSDPRYSSLADGDEKLTTIFFTSPTLVTESDLTQGGTVRFFKEPLFRLNENYYYLSNQWTNTPDGSRLDLNVFKKIIEKYYPEFKIDLEGDKYFLRYSQIIIKNSVHGGINQIYYGAPGTGKSYSIDQSIVQENSFRVVFHTDTQFTDFVGCLKPSMEGGNVIYSFRPGPFINALITALKNPTQTYSLVIEEINRAPAAAVFGEIFQLLDRGADGSSTYGITPSDPEVISYIERELGSTLANGQIKLPSNLNILATMNSSDQAVMPMDTAFKRRWKFKYVPLNFSICASGVFKIHQGANVRDVLWKNFALTVNRILSDLMIPEDRHLGPFFLSNNDLLNEQSTRESLTGKLFIYLWDDVLRHGNRPQIFLDDINTYGELNTRFDKDQQVFSEKFFEVLDLIQPVQFTVTPISENPTTESTSDEPDA